MPKQSKKRKADPPERPAWVLDTPTMYYALEAYVSDMQVEPMRIILTLEEFDTLKTSLAKMRGYKINTVVNGEVVSA